MEREVAVEREKQEKESREPQRERNQRAADERRSGRRRREMKIAVVSRENRQKERTRRDRFNFSSAHSRFDRCLAVYVSSNS
ncbi:hypothetical protein F2Q68_00001650 [Brassica cretica]|uniref:Uncharacterized protein n=1 Tax=Brassica cretica TaxID=69181 RepID=A0A8S9JHT1_BRACR|nr:hypothetical protein F2Q68_00001650 [Brassica cretica]